ncbi:MAG: YfhO family protein [Bacteroidota bacterium]
MPTTFARDDSGFTAIVQKFEPGKFVLEVNSAASGFYVLTQNNYPRWQLTVDGKEEKIFTANKTFIGFGLPAGRHTVVLNYQASDLIIAFCISMLTLLLLVWFVSKRKKLAGVAIPL